MKLRHLGLLVGLAVLPPALLAQRMVRSEAKPAASTSSAHSEIAAQPSKLAQRKPMAAAHVAQAAKFQQVALALNLSSHQKAGVRDLVQSARQQLQAASANNNLTPEQQQAAVQSIKSAMAQKFVGLLTPEQKTELAAMLLKRKQQQNSNSNSSSAASGASPSTPDIPSVDAPSGSDSGDSQAASSQADGSTADSSSAGSGTVASSSAAPSTGATQTPSGKPDSSNSAAAVKPAPLSDAQLAAILNSFVQDDGSQPSSKPAAQGAGSSS